MKKLLLLLLSFLLIISGCGGEDAIYDNPEEEVVEEFKDLDGAHFILKTSWTIEYLPEVGHSLMSDLIRERYADTNAKFNCNFEVIKTTGEAETLSTLNSALAAATDVPDIIQLHSLNAYPLFQNDTLLALDDIPTIDATSDKWGYKHYIKYGEYNGKNYGFFPNNWMIMPEVSGVLSFNNEVLKEMDLSMEPYILQEKNEWTWENYKTLVETCTYKDADNVQRIGFGAENIPFLTKVALFSNGGEIVTEKDGAYSFALNSPNVAEAMDWLNGLKNEKLLVIGDYPKFTDKTFAFWLCDSWKVTIDYEGHELYPAFNMDDYGIIDFPTGPKGSTEQTSAFVHIGRKLAWPIAFTENDYSDLGLVLDYIFEPLPGTTEKAWMNLSERTVFHHEEGYLNFQKMIETARYDYSVQLKDVTARIEAALTKAYSGGSTPAAEFLKIEEMVQTEINETLNIQD